MSLHRVDSAVVADDPFWSVVRRRHPDLAVVLLPEEPPDDRPPTPPDEVRAVTSRLAGAWLGLAAALAPSGTPSVRWARRDGGQALVVERSLTGLGADGGTDLLRRAARHLGERDWRLAPDTVQGHPVLRATDGVLHLEAEAGAAVTTLALSSAPLHLADDGRREARAALLARLAEAG